MARVGDLAGELAVTEETVRRDLKILDEQGVILRTHGGAVRRDDSPALSPLPLASDVPFHQRRALMADAKRAIAREALRLISPGSTIALDGSTTAYELACLLDRTDLTVVTNSLIIASLLGSRPGPTVICVGGTLDRELLHFGGMIALDGLRLLHVDCFFCSCRGVDVSRGYSDPSEAAAHFKRQLIRLADKTVLLADSTKFNARAAVIFGEITDVDQLITDDGADNTVVKAIVESGVECTVARTSTE